ncbi:hypothetical protein QZN01_20965 [Burkholderia cenocepacia]|uniref:hypothetical protein n=1 Tax=Burkholderia cepacia complex TaxID=87882 RepID=UPI002650F299|nr:MULTISPECIES: hypothetical protein [Burkholderia cepacia complex]MDN7558190.1 hypothetical protein [Burkholderia orbicola]MDN7825127.1 hypothetical protein [Burkholderia cenocepacia]
MRKPQRRITAAEADAALFNRDSEPDLYGTTWLPRIAQIDGEQLRTDAHIERIAREWGAVFVGYDQHDAYFRLATHWTVDRPMSGPAQVRDRWGKTRAFVIRETSDNPAVLVLLRRFYVALDATADDLTRVSTFDRAEGRPIRSSPPLQRERFAAVIREHEEWLAEVRPNFRDPFAYWEVPCEPGSSGS